MANTSNEESPTGRLIIGLLLVALGGFLLLEGEPPVSVVLAFVLIAGGMYQLMVAAILSATSTVKRD